MRILFVIVALACGAPPKTEEPCGCDQAAELEGRLCHRLTPAELEAAHGEVGPGWENCPPAKAD